MTDTVALRDVEGDTKMSVQTYIKDNQAALCILLKELVRIPTVNPPGNNYAEIVALLEVKCRTLGMQTQIVQVPTARAEQVISNAESHPRLNLIARWDVGAEKTVHFNAHYDVVPVAGDWRFKPFSGEINGEWLYGRGADDMKDAIAALLFAITAVQEAGIKPQFNVECSFTCDEETGGELGAGYIVEQGLVNADYVVNCEGGGGMNIGNGHNGVLWLEIAVNGKAAHGSQPDKGINAFEKTAELVTTLQRLKQEFTLPERAFMLTDGTERHPTLNIGGTFQGSAGDKVNTVPAQVTFSIDRRIIPNEKLRLAELELREAIASACEYYPDLNADVRAILRIEPCLTESTSPLSQAFAEAVRIVRFNQPQFKPTTGFTDLHFFVNSGLQGIGYGPRGEGGHAINERVHIPDLVRTAAIYATFMTRSAL